MYKLQIDDNVNSFQLEKESSYLCILNVASIPPHISFICKGFYFSYSVYGIKLATDAQARIDVFSKKIIPTVFVSLGSIFNELEIKEVYSKYTELNVTASCLDPIKRLLLSKGLKVTQAPFYLFDLLAWLEDNNMVKSINSINCKELLSNENVLFLQKYTQKEIDIQINNVLNLKK